MHTIRVSVCLADGGVQELTYGPEFVDKLRLLQKHGLAGKNLIHSLITDDWGAPPLVVEISGKDADGHAFTARIPYS